MKPCPLSRSSAFFSRVQVFFEPVRLILFAGSSVPDSIGRPRMRIKTALIMVSFLIVAGGCSRYEKMPLAHDAVAQRLTPPGMDILRIKAGQLKHPLLKPVEIDEREGLTPDGAAVLAVLINPKLVAERDKKGVAAAQLLEAGILPNPQFSFSSDFPTGGATQGTTTAYGYGLSYDIKSLVTRGAQIGAARARASSVDLDTAWQEWQVAESAKAHVYRVILLEKKLTVAREAEKGLEENFAAIKKSADTGDMTITQLAAAQTSLDRVRLQVLTTRRDLEQERLALDQSLGFPPDKAVRLKKDTPVPGVEGIPFAPELLEGLEERRIDLIALKMGYSSQEERLRAAILGQFPKITMGPAHASDTTHVITTGFTLALDIPVFDRNQGKIAIERATREQLFDEYVNRLFEARCKIATARSNLGSIEGQIGASIKAVEALEKLVRTYYTAMLEGNADALTYYNARDELITRRLAVLDLQLKLVDQFITLEIESGRDFEQP